MKVSGTTQQLQQMGANAVNAASPIGLGHLHFTAKTFSPSDIELHDGSLNIDYFQGRMTKLYARRVEDLVWSLPDSDPRPDYQSWSATYPTYEALAKSAGLEVLPDEKEG